MAKRAYPLARVYGLLEPGPVVLVTTARKGRANIMTMSWHTMMEFENGRSRWWELATAPGSRSTSSPNSA